ncbi:MAG TPA: type I-C CRISPR-associated protein Cas8c/Csd1 [Acetobacteraceae bacterium]|nr:type I-C CRISPR-associated protein Cas8c/Csd1 [Acetobacteraceae bacterium]
MIIQNLVALYQRLAADEDPERRLPEPGWKETEIAFVIDLDTDGRPVNVVPLRQPQAKGRPRAPLRLVPQEAKRTGKIPDAATEKDCGKASLFWDNPKYALGLVAGNDAKAKRDAQVCHDLFKLRQAQFAHEAGDKVANDAGMLAMLRFLDAGLLKTEQAAEILESGGNVAFRLDGDTGLICRRPPIRTSISAAALSEDGEGATGQCLVTGQTARIARLHPSIQGVAGAQSSGANIVSFNLPAFESYGLSQGENAPVSAFAAFAYTTALNTLLRQGSKFRVRAGATTVVFWAGKQTTNETVVCDLMAGVTEDDPWLNGDLVARLYDSPRSGVPAPLEDTTPFYILGLSAESKSRLTVRFFHQGTIGQAGETIKRWFEQLAIAPADGPPLSMVRLRRAVSVLSKRKDTPPPPPPPLLEAELLRAAYTGANLPQRILAETLVRCAAEQGPTRERAALIKAFLIRNERRTFTVSLDPDEPDPAYRLGRLFAVLEWIQEAAVGPKAGIAERYWGAASTTPAYVFSNLLELAVHHLAKLDDMLGWRPGFAANRRKDIAAIVAGLPPKLPARLIAIDQGSFAIGYWHQKANRSQGDAASTTDGNAEEQTA